ncbi:methyltransferase domain-containing protein [Candidatus Daviesbacteria bacterium]|nr:methyltransferase domain-containing protein [Candidatus Daviesbacteria bacterium]
MKSRVQIQKNKVGEVEFRKKLALQFEDKAQFFPGAPNATEFNQIIKDRVKNYKSYFKDLNKKKILKTPYLEIGGGVGQAAMLLENKYNLAGFTLDISLDTLLFGKKYLKLLKYKKMPIRICADAYNLPFRSHSIPFIFCFETLHHFPDPKPILKEINRVLAPGGYFYFNEEPIAQSFNLNLWHRDYHLKWYEKILKSFLLLHFLSKIGKSEVKHNILEEAFFLSTWEKALNVFEKVEAKVGFFPFKPTIKRNRQVNGGWLNPPKFFHFLIKFLGGGVEVLSQKKATFDKNNFKTSLVDFFACPNCQTVLEKVSNGFICTRCKISFSDRDGVYIMLTRKQQKKLYNDK